MDKKEQFLRLLDAQRNNYARALPGRLEDIESLWRGVRDGGDSAAAGEDLARAAHALAGSGSTFGYPEVSRLARALELQLQPVVASAPDRQCAQRIAAAIDALRLAIPEVRS